MIRNKLTFQNKTIPLEELGVLSQGGVGTFGALAWSVLDRVCVYSCGMGVGGAA